MKKYGICFAFLAFSAIIAILAACGGEEIAELPTGWEKPMEDLTDPAGGLIFQCEKGTITEENGCPAEPPPPVSSEYTPSSSSGGDSSSSEGGGDSSSGGGVSSSGGGVSSSGGGVSSSGGGVSSSSGGVSSSSAGCTGSGCATVPAFTCVWDPPNVEGGDQAQVKINYTGGGSKPAGCTEEIRAACTNKITGAPMSNSIAIIPIGTNIPTSGERECNPSTGEFKWPTAAPSPGLTSIKGRVTCGAGATQNFEEQNCPLIIGPAPAATKGTGSIGFRSASLDYTVGGSYFYINSAPVTESDVINSVTVGNAQQASCPSAQTQILIEGNRAVAGTIKAVATATCKGGTYRLDSAVATVVPNPGLSGTCAWSKNPTKAATGATPSGVTLGNAYGRCGALTDGALPTTAYTSTSPSVAQWPTNGMIAAGTYGSVSTNVSCASTQVTCPSLTVNAGADYSVECNNSLEAANCSPSGNVFIFQEVGECADISVMGWTNQYNLPNVKVNCETQNGQNSASFSISLNGGTAISASGSYYASTSQPLGAIKLGDNEFGTLCLTAMANVGSVKCTGPVQ